MLARKLRIINIHISLVSNNKNAFELINNRGFGQLFLINHNIFIFLQCSLNGRQIVDIIIAIEILDNYSCKTP